MKTLGWRAARRETCREGRASIEPIELRRKQNRKTFLDQEMIVLICSTWNEERRNLHFRRLARRHLRRGLFDASA